VASASDLLKAEDPDAEASDRARRAGTFGRIGDAVQRRLEFRAAHAVRIRNRHVAPIEREADVASIVRRSLQLGFQMLVDGVADMFLQRVGRVSIQRAEPLQRVRDVEVNGDSLRHGNKPANPTSKGEGRSARGV
jgi:hypothetical protein